MLRRLQVSGCLLGAGRALLCRPRACAPLLSRVFLSTGTRQSNDSTVEQNSETYSMSRKMHRYWKTVSRRLGEDDFDSKAWESREEFVKGLLEKSVRIYGSSNTSSIMPHAVAHTLMESYAHLNETEKRRFIHVLATEYGIVNNEVNKAVALYNSRMEAEASGNASAHDATHALRQSIVPLYERLFNHITQHEGGVKFLVDFRADILRAIRAQDKAHPSVRIMNADLQQLLASWFSIGQLELERIMWSGTSAATLEKIMNYERVHPFEGWKDMRHRLGPNRRCFTFFHPSMPDEPLVFVQVALLDHMASNIQGILEYDHDIHDTSKQHDDENVTTAIFYSISSTQQGLAGVDLGNFLIKRVAERLKTRFDDLHTFATLSPIPGFRDWLVSKVCHGGRFSESLLLDEEVQILSDIDPLFRTNPNEALLNIISSENWHEDAAILTCVQSPMMRLCTRYLLQEKKRQRALDPVANFHLSNGAMVARLNWMGDTSDKGMKQSLGIMVNYQYVLSDIEKNNIAYLVDGVINSSPVVKELMTEQ